MVDWTPHRKAAMAKRRRRVLQQPPHVALIVETSISLTGARAGRENGRGAVREPPRRSRGAFAPHD